MLLRANAGARRESRVHRRHFVPRRLRPILRRHRRADVRGADREAFGAARRDERLLRPRIFLAELEVRQPRGAGERGHSQQDRVVEGEARSQRADGSIDHRRGEANQSIHARLHWSRPAVREDVRRCHRNHERHQEDQRLVQVKPMMAI